MINWTGTILRFNDLNFLLEAVGQMVYDSLQGERLLSLHFKNRIEHRFLLFIFLLYVLPSYYSVCIGLIILKPKESRENVFRNQMGIIHILFFKLEA